MSAGDRVSSVHFTHLISSHLISPHFICTECAAIVVATANRVASRRASQFAVASTSHSAHRRDERCERCFRYMRGIGYTQPAGPSMAVIIHVMARPHGDVNLARILLGRTGERWGREGYPPYRGEVREGPALSPEKMKWLILVNSERYFCPCPRRKNVELPPAMVICWTSKMYTIVLCSFGRDLTYCHHC